MNPKRLRPDGVEKKYLDIWLSGVVWDAIRDARDAGMPDTHVATLVGIIARDVMEQAKAVMLTKREREILQVVLGDVMSVAAECGVGSGVLHDLREKLLSIDKRSGE